MRLFPLDKQQYKELLASLYEIMEREDIVQTPQEAAVEQENDIRIIATALFHLMQSVIGDRQEGNYRPDRRSGKMTREQIEKMMKTLGMPSTSSPNILGHVMDHQRDQCILCLKTSAQCALSPKCTL